MRRTFRYRLYPNKATEKSANETLNLCRTLYNLCLEQRKCLWQHHKKSMSRFEQIKQLPSLKTTFPEFKQVPSQTLQEVVERVDKAFQGFFRRIKSDDKPGYPRFKSFNRYHSFILKQAGWKLTDKELQIRKIGNFKIILHRPIKGDIKTVTIKRTVTNKWLALFSCDNVPKKPLPKTGRIIGIDVGCENFLTTSNGKQINNPRFLKKKEALLKQNQQIFSSKIKGSHRSTKARVLLAKTHEKIVNQRRDFHFKTANYLIKNNDIVCIEKLKSWNSWRALNRSMRDVAWFDFFSCLKEKAEEATRKIIEVEPKNTSQMCSQCGKIVKKDLSVRHHICPFCHLSISRDHNSALNILRLGISLRENLSSSLSREAVYLSTQ